MIAEKTFKRGDIVRVTTDTEPRFKYIVTYVADNTATLSQLGTGFNRIVALKLLEPSHR